MVKTRRSRQRGQHVWTGTTPWILKVTTTHELVGLIIFHALRGCLKKTLSLAEANFT